ncbi:hypothetical protein ACH4UM_18630 [Streptomyces sp. NPDC020801]|uniref:hypothetical protein n=1 Tax=Streptomyces sp. NPDC020801 TaxID=3365093 RepID=UPI0037A2A2D3
MSPDTERVLGQIDRGEMWCGPDAARAIAARHEKAYGAVFGRPAAEDIDAARADALAPITGDGVE